MDVSGDREAAVAGRRQAGLTFVELLTALAVLMILAAAAIPVMRWDEKRRLETHLRGELQIMRDAIDQYHKYSELGLIQQTDVAQEHYPRSLDELVKGVDVGDPNSPTPKTIKFLTRIPIDPMTGQAEWGLRSYQDDWDSDSWGEENVYDVYSLSPGVALDGTKYSEW
ncbi:MAG: type II secretion system GspH family protein [Acidobacteriia bacterium]|nr:type II secretion system GspH family protein [Terriglobia bacterium]